MLITTRYKSKCKDNSDFNCNIFAAVNYYAVNSDNGDNNVIA